MQVPGAGGMHRMGADQPAETKPNSAQASVPQANPQHSNEVRQQVPIDAIPSTTFVPPKAEDLVDTGLDDMD